MLVTPLLKGWREHADSHAKWNWSVRAYFISTPFLTKIPLWSIRWATLCVLHINQKNARCAELLMQNTYYIVINSDHPLIIIFFSRHCEDEDLSFCLVVYPLSKSIRFPSWCILILMQLWCITAYSCWCKLSASVLFQSSARHGYVKNAPVLICIWRLLDSSSSTA